MLPHRFKHYQRNVGWRGTIINLIIVTYLLYAFLRNGIDPVAIVITSALLVGGVLPRFFLTRMVANPQRTTKILGYGTFVVLGAFVLSVTGVWSPSGIPALGMIMFVGVLLGANFWLFSDPRIMTDTGIAHYTAYREHTSLKSTGAHHGTTE